jgi:hypothetical protein
MPIAERVTDYSVAIRQHLADPGDQFHLSDTDGQEEPHGDQPECTGDRGG